MSIKNIKASFILEEKVNAPSKNCIFKQDNVVYTIYPHFRNLVNVTGIKRFEQLEMAKKIIESKLKLKVVTLQLITLCNKDFGAWDISPDSTLLGFTDT